MVAVVTAAAVAALSISATLPARYCDTSNTCWPAAAEWDTLNAPVAGRLFVVQRPAAASGPAGAFLHAAEPGAMQHSKNWESVPAFGVRAAAADDVVAVMHHCVGSENGPVERPPWKADDERAAQVLCTPSASCWPGGAEWAALKQQVNGSLFAPNTTEYDAASRMMAPNWRTAAGHSKQLLLPAYAVVAHSVADVIAAVKFCDKHNIRISVKTSGHDYNGRSTASDSLLIFMHDWKGIEWHQSFDTGCPGTVRGPAVNVNGGVAWGDLDPLLAQKGFLTPGGNSLTVSVNGGYMQGGGYSFTSPLIGLAADNVLAVDIVTADGVLHHTSECREPELFRALRGGGGGTYGVVVSATHKLTRAPKVVVGLDTYIPLKSDTSTAKAIDWVETFVKAQPQMEEVAWSGAMTGLPYQGFVYHGVYLGESYEVAMKAIAPLRAFHETKGGGSFQLVNHSSWWDWHGNQSDYTGSPWWGVSRLIPSTAFREPAQISSLVKFLHDAVAVYGIGYDCDSAVGGAASTYDSTADKTAVSPFMRAATWELLMYTGWGEHASVRRQNATVAKMNNMSKTLRALAPDSGCYMNECDYFEPDWRIANWGGEAQYARLMKVKSAVDPKGLLRCHHCVGDDGDD